MGPGIVRQGENPQCVGKDPTGRRHGRSQTVRRRVIEFLTSTVARGWNQQCASVDSDGSPSAFGQRRRAGTFSLGTANRTSEERCLPRKVPRNSPRSWAWIAQRFPHAHSARELFELLPMSTQYRLHGQPAQAGRHSYDPEALELCPVLRNFIRSRAWNLKLPHATLRTLYTGPSILYWASIIRGVESSE